jgi:hypothetical protein
VKRPFLIPPPRRAEGVSKALHQAFDPVTKEPLPRDILALVKALG